MADSAGLYQILEIPEPVARGRHLLGSVVPTNTYTAPLTNYAPYYDDPHWETEEGKKQKKNLDDNLKTLWQASSEKMNSVPLSSLLSSQGASSSDDANAKVTKILRAYFNKSGKKNFKIEKGDTEQYNMDNAGRALGDRLCKCQPWLNQVQKLYDEDTRKGKDLTYLLVTGVWACQNTEVSWDEDAISKKGLASELPTKELAAAAAASQGVMIPTDAVKALDAELKYDASREQHQRKHVTMPEPTIFAVRYHLLDLHLEPKEKEKSKSSSGFWGSITGFFRTKRTNSGLSDAPKPKIKSLSLGQPLRGGNRAIGSYGNGPRGQLYWAEPDYVSPEDLVATEEPEAEARDAPNGLAH